MAEEKVNTILGPIDQAFVAAIAWDKSNKLKETKGIVDTKNISTLSDYLSNHKILHPVSQDVIDSKNNKRTYVIPVDATRGDGSTFKFNLVVDSKGKDLAIIPLNIDGKEAEGAFKLASKLEEQLKTNKDALSKKIDPKKVDAVLDVKSLEDMAEKIAKGEKVVADSPKEALEEVQKKDSDVKQDISLESDKEDKEKEDDKEQEEEQEKIPEEYKTKIEEACEKAGIKRSALKQAMVVRNPKSLTNSLENENITEYGGEVIVLQLKGGVEKNRNVLVQGNRIDQTGRYDEELSRRMSSSSKFGATVENAEVNKNDSLVIELPMADGSITLINMDEEPINSQLSDMKKLNVEEKANTIRETWKTNLQSASSKEQRCAAYDNANRSLALLEKEYGINLDKFEDSITAEHEQVDERAEEEEIAEKEEITEKESEENLNEEKTEEADNKGIEGYEDHYGHSYADPYERGYNPYNNQ